MATKTLIRYCMEGDREPGSNGVGSVWGAREKRAEDGIIKGTGAGTNYEKIDIAKGGGGNWEFKVREAGNSDPTPPPPPLSPPPNCGTESSKKSVVNDD